VNFIHGPERLTLLRIGTLEALCYPLWSSRWRDRLWWERIAAIPFVLVMAAVNLFGAATSIYFSDAIPWLGERQVDFVCWLEDHIFGFGWNKKF